LNLPFVAKSVFRRLGRYGFLVAMIAFGIAAVTLVQAVTVGMTANVTEGSARYLGGRYVVIARRAHGYSQNLIEDPAAVASALGKAGLRPSLVVQREVAGDSDQTLFFNGESLRMRRVSGVDARNEAGVLSRLLFTSGGFADLPGSNGILVSQQVASRFSLRVGDELTLRLTNAQGYLDSAQLVVQGIFRDASIFGYYNCYVDFGLLHRLLGHPEGACSAMGFYFSGREDEAETLRRIDKALAAAGFHAFPRLQDRNDLNAAWNSTWEGVRYGVLPVENYIDAKVMDLIHAIQMVSYLFLGLILVIILVGMRNTTQIMTRRRFKEIGTIRALGMTEGGATGLVLCEALLVAGLGFVIGLAAAVAVLLAIQPVPFQWSDGFDIFLRAGHLSWKLSFPFLAGNFAALVLMTAAGALPAARKAAHIAPAAAIAANE
jgi:ABC-type lipoprotein release transport system permease subunit